MSVSSPFIDHYEILQLSQSADGGTIERVYRLLAKRFHPDNRESGNTDRFTEVQRSFEVLSNPERRAAFDVSYDTEKSMQWKIFEQGSAMDRREQDRRIFHGILSLLYVARRRDPDEGGLGPIHLEKMLGTPARALRVSALVSAPTWLGRDARQRSAGYHRGRRGQARQQGAGAAAGPAAR